MFDRSCKVLASSFVLTLALGGCNQANENSEITENGPQTRFPGQFTAGGSTSGTVMAQNGTLQAKPEKMGSPVLVPAKAAESNPPGRSDTPPQGAAENTSAAGTGEEAPEGTPGIPEGAGGNVSGTEMGATTPGAAASKQAPAQQQSSGASPEAEKAKKEAEEKAKAEKEKQQLDAAMNRVAQRWQETASARGWQTEANTSGQAGGQAQTQTSVIGLPAVVRSEKLETAPPSEDVKQPERDPSN